jgi:hypothetical protein
MATYIQGLTQYLPQIQPFQRDFNFYANVMQKKQTEYDSGHEQMNKLYGSVFYSDVSRDDMKERKDEILKAIDFNLKKVSALDVSLKQNQRQAQQVFRPFYEDKELMKDIVYTKTYQQEVRRGLSAKECVGKDCPETYWDGGIRLLEHQMNRFKNASLNEAMQMRNPSYTPYFNIMKEGAKLIKENGFEIVTQGPQGGYMVKEKNGPQAIMSFNDFLFQQFSNDPRAVDFYNAKAQLSFYDNPEETINQYELHRIRQRAKDEKDYKELLAEHKKEKEFNKSKNIVSAAKSQAGNQLANKTLERKVFQDYANELGELFSTSPDKTLYDQIVREEQALEGTYQNLNNLEDNFRGITYIDKETGERVPEHIITSVVANGMLVNETLGVAQSIAMNTYQQTVTGADPYAMADYRHKLAKQLIDYRNEQNLIYGTGGSGSGSKGKSPGTTLTDAEKKEAEKRIKEANAGLDDQGLQLKLQEEYLKMEQEKIQNVIQAVDQNRITPKDKQHLKEIQERTNQRTTILGAAINDLVANIADNDFQVQLTDPTKGNVSFYAQLVEAAKSQGKKKSTTAEGKVTWDDIDYSDLRNGLDNQQAYNISKFEEAKKENAEYKNAIGGLVKNQLINLISNPGNMSEAQMNAVNLILTNVLPKDKLQNVSAIQAELLKLDNKNLSKLYSVFIKPSDDITKLKGVADKGIDIVKKYAGNVTNFAQAVEVYKQASDFKDKVVSKRDEIEFYPQIQAQAWKSLGLPDGALQALILTSQQDVALNRRISNYNQANKEALVQQGNSFLNKIFSGSGISINDIRPNNFSNFVLNDSTQKYQINDDDKKKYISKFYNSTSIEGKRYLSANQETLGKLILSAYPVSKNSTVNDYKQAFEAFVMDHVNDNLEVSKIFNDLFSIRNANTKGDVYTGAYLNDKKLIEFVNTLDPKVKQKLKDLKLIVNSDQEKVLAHHFLYDLLPSETTQRDVITQQMDALMTRGSKGNVYGGAFSGTQTNSDWAPTGMSVVTDLKVNQFSIPQQQYYNNLVTAISQTLNANPNNTFKTSVNTDGVIITRGANDYGEEAFVDSSSANSIVSFYQDLMSKKTRSSLVDKPSSDVPGVKINTVTTSKYGAEYSNITFDISGSSNKQLEAVGAVKESAYNKGDSKFKAKVDEKGLKIIPDKTTFTIETKKVPELQKINIDNDIMSLQAGDIRGSYEHLRAEVKIKNIQYKPTMEGTIPTVHYELTYGAIELDEDSGKPKIVKKTVTPSPYEATSSMSFSEITGALLNQANFQFEQNLLKK